MTDLSPEESRLKRELDTLVTRINSPEFISQDPVQFPRLFSDPRDIEIVSLLVSGIAWGNRTMICRNCSKMLSLMDMQPYNYMMDKGYEELPDMNIHRTFFARNLRHYLRGLRLLYSRYGSMEDFARRCGATTDEFPAWRLARGVNEVLLEANGCSDSRCMPAANDSSAMKRLNMALRWLVRDDGIVDLGIWKSMKPSQLYIPLDVHVANISRSYGLLQRKSNDKKAVVELTSQLRRFRPDDPVIYDYALFGLGIELSKSKKQALSTL